MPEINSIGNYAKHAFIWDTYGPPDDPDNIREHEYWLKYAEGYGKNVLIPMCAVGTTGAYLAKHGFNVTAFDITPEMIEEGEKRFRDIKNLSLRQGDIRDFSFDIAPVDFCYCVDFGHIQTLDEIRKALLCIQSHLRKGGALVVIAGLRNENDKSQFFPPERFDFGEVLPGIKAWKINNDKCHTDGENGRRYISQDIYIEDINRGSVEVFDHSFYLQSYYREEWLKTFDEAGFEIRQEYKNREKDKWQMGDTSWIAEAVKK